MREKNFYIEEDLYETEERINLVNFIFILLRNWKLIVAIAIPILTLGAFFVLTRLNVYKVEVIMMVSKDGGFSSNSLDEGELSVNRKLAATYTEIAKNSVILKNIIKKYDLSVTVKELQNDVTINSIGNTELLRLTYKNSDSNLAAAVANEIGNEFMLKIREIMNFQNIKVIEPAEPVKEALPQKKAITIAILCICSIIFGCVVAIIIEFISCKLRRLKDVERILKVPMIGAVPDLKIFLVDGGKNEK